MAKILPLFLFFVTVTSNRLMQYILRLYVYDTNTILVEPIKTIIDADMLRAYDFLYEKL